MPSTLKDNAPRPLARFRVIEVNAADAPLLTRLATAMAGKIAADLGATVIKIEPGSGDPLRYLPPFLPAGSAPACPASERSALFQFLNTSKHSVVLADAAARARLIAAADAVLTDDPALADAGPRVRVLVSPLPGHGPFRGFPSPPVEQIDILAMSGLMDIIGEPDGEPLKLGGHQCAYTAGLAAFTGLVAALANKNGANKNGANKNGANKNGANEAVAERVDVSILDVARWTNWKTFADRLYTGRSPTRPGAVGEFQVLACADGHAAFVYVEKDWPTLAAMFADPGLLGPGFATRAERQANAAAINARIAPWFAVRTRAEIYAEAKRTGVPVSAVWRIGDLAADPQYVAQNFFAAIAHPVHASLTFPTIPVVWNGARFAPSPAPALACACE